MSKTVEPVQPVLEPAPPSRITEPAVDEEWITVPGGPTGSVRARIVKPAGSDGTLPVILCIHGRLGVRQRPRP